MQSKTRRHTSYRRARGGAMRAGDGRRDGAGQRDARRGARHGRRRRAGVVGGREARRRISHSAGGVARYLHAQPAATPTTRAAWSATAALWRASHRHRTATSTSSARRRARYDKTIRFARSEISVFVASNVGVLVCRQRLALANDSVQIDTQQQSYAQSYYKRRHTPTSQHTASSTTAKRASVCDVETNRPARPIPLGSGGAPLPGALIDVYALLLS
jgi:hypothetical protein